MENTDPASKAPSQPPAGRFMDVKGPDAESPNSDRPVADEATPQSDQKTVIAIDSSDYDQTESSSDTPVETNEVSAQEPDSSPEETVPVVPSDPAQTAPTAEFPEQPADNSSPVSDTTEPVADHQQTDQHLQHHKSSGVPVVALVVAIVVTLALSGLVIYAFMKSKNDTNLGETSSTNSKTTTAKPQASPSDVDQATSDIDTSLSSIDDAADFSATDISDQSLGL